MTAHNQNTRYKAGGRVDPALLPRGPNGRALCRWCGAEVPSRRRTFCSAGCVHEYKLRTNGAYLRAQVYRRDRGVCAACGLDTKTIAEELWEARLQHGEGFMHRLMVLHGVPPSRKVWKRKYGGGLWDADHILAVKDGGGQCALGNIQTLCLPCHRAKTVAGRRTPKP